MSSSSAESKMVLAKIVLSTVGPIAVTTMLVCSIIHDYIPLELHEYLFFGLKSMFTKFSNQLTMTIDEFDGLVNNGIYEAAEIYLANKLSPNIHRLKISKPGKEKNFNITMERNEESMDVRGQLVGQIDCCRFINFVVDQAIKFVNHHLGSIAATTMFVHSIIHDYIPQELHEYLFFGLRNMFTKFSNQLTMMIDKFNGLVNNEIYEATETYFGNNLSPNIHQLKISKPEKEKNFNIAMERNEEVTDVSNGQNFKWICLCRQTESTNFNNSTDMNSTLKSEIRSFEVTFHKKNRDINVIKSYLSHIMKEANCKNT
ncbi:hypothetical protein H5410_014096 [Solanum commersonii]|uniref:AAA-type ATPase N-terminal domain-containing protein n=1 Tax=Solanum commersonii TaxID=4109 RepID=A0A9J5ZQ15_SOLCO|nr:hypothetical protein H5410_014096 [Solanum commersonii]